MVLLLEVPADVSVPSLSGSSMGCPGKFGKEETITPGTGTTSSVSSDISTVSQRRPASADSGGAGDRWYYYLSNEAVERLPKFQYQGGDLSLLYKHVLSPFAGWCVDNLTPAWLAPNAITLIGLCWMVFSYCVIWCYCPGMHEANTDVNAASSVPAVIFLLNGCAMLIYQTLDNMDGKQARKTGSSSPLGLLFDHGCDAMNSVIGSANWIAAMAMVPGNVGDLMGGDGRGNVQGRSLLSELLGGDAVLAALLILSPMIAFYVATWEQYYTGKLVLPPFNGPSEGLVMGATLSIVSFLWGPMYWQSTSLADGAIAKLGPFDEMQGRVRNMDLIIVASLVGIAQEVSLKTVHVVRNYGTKTLRTVLPNFLLAAATLTMVYSDPTLFLRRPRTMMHLISGVFTEMVTQLMLDHMVEEQYEASKRWCLFPMVMLAAWMASSSPPSSEFLDEYLLFYTTALWVYLAFKIRVHIYEICDVLGIYCFDIVTPHPKKMGASKAQEEAAAKKTN